MRLLDGRTTSKNIKLMIKDEVAQNSLSVNLAIILAGDDAASKMYANSAAKSFREAGMGAKIYEYGNNVGQEELECLIDTLNKNKNVNGIIVQIPLPKHIVKERIIEKISPEKDVDGLTSTQMGLLFMNKAKLFVCTPFGVMQLFKEYNINLIGKHAVVIGRSNIVGKPMAQMLLNADATVTMCHSKTKNMSFFTKNADVIVVATGVQNTLTADMVSEGAIVIDIGINQTTDGVVGDVDFEKVAPKCAYITPVPGGIGSMTVAMLMLNTLNAYKLQKERDVK